MPVHALLCELSSTLDYITATGLLPSTILLVHVMSSLPDCSLRRQPGSLCTTEERPLVRATVHNKVPEEKKVAMNAARSTADLCYYFQMSEPAPEPESRWEWKLQVATSCRGRWPLLLLLLSSGGSDHNSPTPYLPSKGGTADEVRNRELTCCLCVLGMLAWGNKAPGVLRPEDLLY